MTPCTSRAGVAPRRDVAEIARWSPAIPLTRWSMEAGGQEVELARIQRGRPAVLPDTGGRSRPCGGPTRSGPRVQAYLSPARARPRGARRPSMCRTSPEYSRSHSPCPPSPATAEVPRPTSATRSWTESRGPRRPLRLPVPSRISPRDRRSAGGGVRPAWLPPPPMVGPGDTGRAREPPRDSPEPEPHGAGSKGSGGTPAPWPPDRPGRSPGSPPPARRS